MSHETHGKFSFEFQPEEFGKFLRMLGLKSSGKVHRWSTADALREMREAQLTYRTINDQRVREAHARMEPRPFMGLRATVDQGVLQRGLEPFAEVLQLESSLTWEHYFGVLKAEGIRHELTPLDELELLEMGIGGAPRCATSSPCSLIVPPELS